MKIASFTTNGYPSTESKYLSIFTHEQAKEFQNQGSSIEVFDLNPPNSIKENKVEVFEGITVHRILPIKVSRPSQSIRTFVYLKKQLIDRGFSHILLSFLDSQYIKYLPSFPKKVDFYITVHGRDAMIPPSTIKGIIKKSLKKYIFKRSKISFPVTEYTETLLSCLINRKSTDDKKIKVIYNGINIKKFESVIDLHKDSIRKEFELPIEKFIVLSVCQLIKRKGIKSAVQGTLNALRSNPNILHIIVGRGPEKKEILNLVKDFPNNFLFLENLSDEILAKFYRASDIYMMISKTLWEERATEGFGISYIEASYLGLPVISGKDGGSIIAVQNSFTGFWVDPNDEDLSLKIGNYINDLYNDPELYESLSRNGQRYSKSFFSWEKNVNAVTEQMRRK